MIHPEAYLNNDADSHSAPIAGERLPVVERLSYNGPIAICDDLQAKCLHSTEPEALQTVSISLHTGQSL